MQKDHLAVVILAAGKGKRMKSDLPKVLHELGSKTLLSHVLETVKSLAPERTVIVVGHQAKKVESQFSDHNNEFVVQKEQLGTGHAVQQAQEVLENFEGNVLILCGDMPLLKESTLKNLIKSHENSSVECTLLSLKTKEPKDFGRIVRDVEGNVSRIVEFKDATEMEKAIDEYNSGVYCFNKSILFKILQSIDNKNSQSEFYLTDAIRLLTEGGNFVQCVQTNDDAEILGINSKADLKKAEEIFYSRKNV